MKYKTRVAFVPVEDEPSGFIPTSCMETLDTVLEELGDITIVSVSQCPARTSYLEDIEGRDYRQHESGILYTIIYTV